MKRFAASALFAASLLPLCAQENAAAPAPTPNVETGSPTPHPASAASKPVAPTAHDGVDKLPEGDLKEFLNVVRDHYIAATKINDVEVLRATVQGLLDRLAPGVSLAPPTSENPNIASPFRSEIIDNRVGYLRMGALTTDHLGELDAALQNISS